MGGSPAERWRAACAALALAVGLGACVPTYRVAPLPGSESAQRSGDAIAVGDLVELRRRDGTTVGGRVVAVDAASVTLEVRGQGRTTARIERATIERVERFEPGRALRNVLVIGAIVIGVVMVLMAGGPPGATY